MNFKILKQLTQNFSLLYVEDDEIIRKKTSTIFKNLFRQVDIAKNGKEGLDIYEDYYKATSKYYDIVISDIKIPKFNGIELAKKIFDINKQQTVIIVSAYDNAEYLVDLINLGAQGFLKKPFTSENLMKILHDACNSFEKSNIVSLYDGYKYNITTAVLYINEKKVDLSTNELKLLHLLIKNRHQTFSAIEIFNHIYFDDPQKKFSIDSIKSLIKRLRKKTPKNFIINTQRLGYSANFSV
ncbi:MAG: response regulator transcription factor [Epsilonproteobacteria bacterium]|nr:response regulator transcription factor [Campylobacterota bacterium]